MLLYSVGGRDESKVWGLAHLRSGLGLLGTGSRFHETAFGHRPAPGTSQRRGRSCSRQTAVAEVPAAEAYA